MQKPDREALRYFGLSALLYLVLDLAIQKTGYLGFGPIVGLKSFLPATVGLLFGLYAVLGTCAGCLIRMSRQSDCRSRDLAALVSTAERPPARA